MNRRQRRGLVFLVLAVILAICQGTVEGGLAYAILLVALWVTFTIGTVLFVDSGE